MEMAKGLGREDLDETDRGIIAQLREDGRRPNSRIARALGVSEATVRKRLERLRSNGVVQIIGLVNPALSDLPVDVVIGLNVNPASSVDIGSRLTEMEEVVWVAHVTGRYQLMVEVLLADNDALIRFMNESLGSLGGILSAETITVLSHVKLNYILDLPGGPVHP